MKRLVFSVALLFLLGFGLFAYKAYVFLSTVPEKEGRSVYVDVPPGARLPAIAERLERDHLITNATFFTWFARLSHKDGKLQSGRFALTTSLRPVEVLDILVNGKPVLYRVTIPEGLPWWKTAHLLAEQGFVDEKAFTALLFDPAFLKKYGIPFASAEGFLMPDTYLVKTQEQFLAEAEAQGTTQPRDVLVRRQAELIAGRLIETFWKRSAQVWPGGKRPGTEELKRLVVLASIVEKETSVPEERARVAGVYANRLKRKMLLQADPTVIYGLGPTFSGRLLYRHLDDTKNPYNTYQHAGLPPGPICSFGVRALKAACMPEAHKYLYFVAKRDGGEHVFSERLEDHNKAVEQYRKSVRKKP